MRSRGSAARQPAPYTPPPPPAPKPIAQPVPTEAIPTVAMPTVKIRKKLVPVNMLSDVQVTDLLYAIEKGKERVALADMSDDDLAKVKTALTAEQTRRGLSDSRALENRTPTRVFEPRTA